MRKYRFGIDIDGTVTCPTSLLPHINQAFKRNLVLEDIQEYDLTKALPDIDPLEFGKWFKISEPEIYATSPIRDDAREVLSEWNDRYELYFISARGSNVQDITYKWFLEHEVVYDHIELIGTHNKIATAKMHGVHAFFEDKHDNAVAIHEELKIPVILFDAPYNRDPIPDGVFRVSNWKEAKHIIEQEFAIEKAQ
ncbi:hypothetical protein ACFOZY_11830 [Chungangia koreensis]|uniref:Nucleotidase n=1 Tax=Chungangia koreensis TaxID=752657 RepID=A0ABV8X741_9LACT